jgi:hypothetical protein
VLDSDSCEAGACSRAPPTDVDSACERRFESGGVPVASRVRDLRGADRAAGAGPLESSVPSAGALSPAGTPAPVFISTPPPSAAGVAPAPVFISTRPPSAAGVAPAPVAGSCGVPAPAGALIPVSAVSERFPVPPAGASAVSPSPATARVPSRPRFLPPPRRPRRAPRLGERDRVSVLDTVDSSEGEALRSVEVSASAAAGVVRAPRRRRPSL